MKITSVYVNKKSENGRMKGTATVVIDECFRIRDIRIIEKDGKLILAMPSRKNPEGKYHDIAHPLNQETRSMFEEAIFEEYNKVEEENS